MIHARESRLPTVIGVDDAVSLLSRLHGKVVTLDSSAGAVYVGAVPIIPERRHLSLWAEEASGDSKEDTEDVTKHPNYRERPDGGWFARPLIPYSALQLDVCRLAFSFYRTWLQRLDWPSGDAKPPIRMNVIDIKDNILWVKVNDGGSPEAEFMASLTLDDCEFLMERRWHLLRELCSFFEQLTEISASNVKRVVDALIVLLGINSLGHEFRMAFEAQYLRIQLQYVSSAYVPLLMRMALGEQGDPLCRDIDAEHRKRMLAVSEMARTDTATVMALQADGLSAEDAIQRMGESNPVLLREIEKMSETHKLKSEDIRKLSDTADCIRWLKERLRSGQEDVAPEQRETNQERVTVRAALTSYPKLCRTLAVAASEARFRGNFHHLVVRCMRKVASLVLQIRCGLTRALIRSPFLRSR